MNSKIPTDCAALKSRHARFHRMGKRIRPILLLLFTTASARASDLGSDGRLHFAGDAILTVDFEDPSALAARARWVVAPRGASTWTYQPTTAAGLTPHLVTSNDALEGRSVLRWTGADGLGLAIVDPAVFASIASQRVTVSFWGRAEGMEPFLAVTYGNEIDIATTKPWAWARIPAIRTGRETSDGWVEYSTGPIDGSVLDRPVHDLVISARVPTVADTALRLNVPALHPFDAISIDAVEIRSTAGQPATGACTAANIDMDCGPASESFFGRCVDSAVTWHPLPGPAMQQEIVARVVNWATTFLGDRSASTRADANWATATLALASATATPKTFWGGLSRQVVALRDTHTRLGSPYGGISTPFAVRPSSNSGPLNVCFGPTVNDLEGGQLAYVLWSKGPAAPSTLQIGDVLHAIDGMEPKAWVDAVYPRYASSLPIVPAADWAPSARVLASLIAKHASTLTVSRCDPSATCVVQPPIDVAGASLAAISGGQYPTPALNCTPRFTNVVTGALADPSGGDLFLSAALDTGTLGIEFDGFRPTDSVSWKASVDGAFTLPHGNVIVDAREGFGGFNALGNYLFQQFRGTDSPSVLVLAARGTFGDPDDPSLFSFDWTSCLPSPGFQCATADIYVYQTVNAAPVAAGSKVAWLNTDDFSNNDMVPRLLKGRANFRIFAPFPTYGALGSDVEIPPLMPNWTSGTIAASDGRYGATIATAEASPAWESGTGVDPDVVVTQTLSDVLASKDTIVAAARSWLAQ
jgi:hypothetical protein